MTLVFSIDAQDGAYQLSIQGKPMLTPGKMPLRLPTLGLAEAVAAEWQKQQKYSSNAMPLTALAYTALDRIDSQKEAIIEALLVYADTDALCYRAEAGEPTLAQLQREQWEPVVRWASVLLGQPFQSTTGIMPLEQSAELHAAIGQRLRGLDAMRLAAACQIASLCSSLILMLAVLERHIDAPEAYRLSRLEEETQAIAWGRDEEAEKRRLRLQAEVLAAGEFLRLLA